MSDTSYLNLLTIPHDLHVEILSFVPVRYLLVYSRCCKHFKAVTEDDRLWATKEAIPVCVAREAPVPFPRLCLAALVYKNSLVIYGGDTAREEKIDAVRNDLWAFNFNEGGKWEEFSAKGGALRPMLTEHSAVLYCDNIYLFGGNCGNSDTSSQFILGNTVHRIDLGTKLVREVKTEKPPLRRSAHTAVLYKDKMYIYGGWNGHESHADFQELDLRTLQWQTVSATGESPGRRRAHCAVVHDHYMYIFGGYDTAPASRYSQMHRFDFEKGHWEIFYGTGDVPRGRSRADMVAYQDKIYVVGGWNRDKREYFGDLCEFNIQTHAWKIYKTSLQPLVNGICQHKCVLYDHWLLVIFGFSAKDGASTNKIFAINLRRKATK